MKSTPGIVSQPPTDMTKVGIITSAHGVRGQVKIRSFTQSPEDIFSYKTLYDASGKRRFTIKREGIQKLALIVSIEGLTDRNEAELLKGVELFAPALPAKKKSANQWTYGELTGLQARLADGTVFGTVTGVYNFGAGDVLDIEKPGGESEMLPFSNAYVGEVRPPEGYLVVIPPEYLEPAGNPGNEEP